MSQRGLELNAQGRRSAVVGFVAALLALAYLERAATAGGAVSWFFCALLGVVSAVNLAPLARATAAPVAAKPALVVEPTDVEDTGPVARVAPLRIDPVAAVRSARQVRRADIVSDAAPRVAFVPERVEHVDLTTPGAVVVPESVRVVANPVVGPQLRRARELSGLSIDDLSERTMIRPHVLEAIEGDNFDACGGDFYARGHLRTLARFLGLSADRLVALYDERYAHAPIAARRVFEAELAANLGSGLVSRPRGPRWSLVAAAVLMLLMVWGAARFFTVPETPVTGGLPGDTAGLAANAVPITSPLAKPQALALAATLPVDIVVRDRQGAEVWRGHLNKGQTQNVSGDGPFLVQTTNGKATSVVLDGADQGTVGDTAVAATRTVG